jgi:SAM-dependent methyltransferase
MSTDERLSETELCPPALLEGQKAAFARDVERLLARRDEFVAVACPACGADEGAPAFEKWGFAYLSCPRCRTIYMSPRPSPAVMDGYYATSENYAYWAEHIFPASQHARREKVNRPWLERIIGFCERHGVPRGTLVEVGPGFGTFAALARESGAFERVVAVEANPDMAQACRDQGVEVVARPIEEAAGALPDADVVCAFEVTEHLFEPRRFIDDCATLLRPGGLLVLSCPNGLGFDIGLLGPASLAVDPEHVNLLNPQSLSLLAQSCGFDVLEVTTPGRLDVEFAHDAIAAGEVPAPEDPFLRRVLVDEYEHLGWPFQQFLAEHGLSSHMWLAARRR